MLNKFHSVILTDYFQQMVLYTGHVSYKVLFLRKYMQMVCFEGCCFCNEEPGK